MLAAFEFADPAEVDVLRRHALPRVKPVKGAVDGVGQLRARHVLATPVRRRQALAGIAEQGVRRDDRIRVTRHRPPPRNMNLSPACGHPGDAVWLPGIASLHRRAPRHPAHRRPRDPMAAQSVMEC
jgi:hypothetical protein